MLHSSEPKHQIFLNCGDDAQIILRIVYKVLGSYKIELTEWNKKCKY